MLEYDGTSFRMSESIAVRGGLCIFALFTYKYRVLARDQGCRYVVFQEVYCIACGVVSDR